MRKPNIGNQWKDRGTILFLVFLAGLLIWSGSWAIPKGHEQLIEGEIIAFQRDPFHSDLRISVIVQVRLDDGRIVSTDFPKNIKNCSVGSRLKLRSFENGRVLATHACSRSFSAESVR